uniref:Uncharacterized protein n=1 Tax=Pristionchus pacificus TaxID=54126 RepID=A0A2A6CWA9_PRIPA|eukprot:PDM82301.1 hypothetical protein PRIPAC_36694 [Pristionchus pacificus]
MAIRMSLDKMTKIFTLLKSLIFGRTSISSLRIYKVDPELFRQCRLFFEGISVNKFHIFQKHFGRNK